MITNYNAPGICIRENTNKDDGKPGNRGGLLSQHMVRSMLRLLFPNHVTTLPGLNKLDRLIEQLIAQRY